MIAGHELVAVTDLPLAPVDVAAVAALTADGKYVHGCRCGLYFPAGRLLDVHRAWRLHVTAVMRGLAHG